MTNLRLWWTPCSVIYPFSPSAPVPLLTLRAIWSAGPRDARHSDITLHTHTHRHTSPYTHIHIATPSLRCPAFRYHPTHTQTHRHTHRYTGTRCPAFPHHPTHTYTSPHRQPVSGIPTPPHTHIHISTPSAGDFSPHTHRHTVSRH